MALGSLHGSFCPASAMQGLLWACCRPIRGAAIRIVRVVVVDVAARVDIPCVVGVASIGRTQANVLRFTAYILMLNVSLGNVLHLIPSSLLKAS